MKRLTDGELDILAEQEADARDVGECEPEDWYDVLESADCLEDVLNELLDAAEGEYPF